MRPPSRRNSAINVNRMRKWIHDFGSYRTNINEGRIDRWLDQFDKNDRDLAARVLDSVEFISHSQMTTAFRHILSGLDGWDIDEAKRRGNWRFVAFSGSAGESGDSMLHHFRHANNLASRRHNRLFIHRSDILSQNLGPDDSIVFVDDFSGTGDQACNAWREQIEELLPGGPFIYLVLIVASQTARKRITDTTNMSVIPYIELHAGDNIFSSTCSHFTAPEKNRILNYCKKADHKNPRGYGNCGFVIVFQNSCPNNSIPILHISNERWEGLFPRYD